MRPIADQALQQQLATLLQRRPRRVANPSGTVVKRNDSCIRDLGWKQLS